MAPCRADYYLTAVAKHDGMEGYYLAHGEEPGRGHADIDRVDRQLIETLSQRRACPNRAQL